MSCVAKLCVLLGAFVAFSHFTEVPRQNIVRKRENENRLVKSKEDIPIQTSSGRVEDSSSLVKGQAELYNDKKGTGDVFPKTVRPWQNRSLTDRNDIKRTMNPRQRKDIKMAFKDMRTTPRMLAGNEGESEGVDRMLMNHAKRRRRRQSMSPIKPINPDKNPTLPPIPVLRACSTEFSCKQRCQKSENHSRLHKALCYCDEDCTRFMDCCADFEHYCLTNATSHSNDSSSNFSMNVNSSALSSPMASTKREWGPWKCFHYDTDKESDKNGTNGVWMINTCPSTWMNDDISRKCETLSHTELIKDGQTLIDSLPVYAADGKVYRNRFCAACNGVSRNGTTPYGLSIRCKYLPPENVNKLDFFLAYCPKEISWKPPHASPRRHCFDITSACPKSSSKEEKERCANGKVGIMIITRVVENYRNIHCTKCRGLPIWRFKCGPRTSNRDGRYKPPAVAFSVIFDFAGINKNSPAVTYYRPKCEIDGEVYDPYLETCHAIIIPPPTPSLLEHYRILMWLPFPSDQKDPSYYETKAGIPNALAATFDLSAWNVSVITMVYHRGAFEVIVEAKRWADAEDKKTNTPNVTTQSFDRILSFDRPLNITIKGVVFTVVKATKRIMSCPYLKHYNEHEYTVLQDPRSAVYINASMEIINAKDYYYSNGSAGVILVCHAKPAVKAIHRLNCTGMYIAMKDEQFTLLPNKSIYLNASTKVYHPSAYFRMNGTMVICIDRPLTNRRNLTDNEALSYLTLVCMSLSILGLAFFLVTYSLFSALRTTPGINLMNLSSSLLLAQLIWLTGAHQTRNASYCYFIAASLHYFFLVSFMWSSIIAYDTWRAFSRKGHRAGPVSKREKMCHNLRYMAVGWLAVLVFVGVCVALDMSMIVRIGYGSVNACWISNTMAILYCFVIPIAVALISNIVFYTLTVTAIRTIGEQARMAAENSRNRRQFGIYVRIGALMGFTWVFGFVAVYWSPLWYAFTILNCLQGVYIAVAFALNQRARGFYRRLVRLGKESHDTTGSTSTTKYNQESTAGRVQPVSGSPTEVVESTM